MNENHVQVFALFNKSAAAAAQAQAQAQAQASAPASALATPSLSGIANCNGQATVNHLKPLNTSLATIAKFDKSVFTPGRVEISAFYNNLFNILNYQSDEPNWPAIIVLQEAAKNIEARHVLVHTYKFLPSLTRYLKKLQNPDQIMQLLLLVEELTYGVKLNWQESYLISLLKLLSKWIMQIPVSDSVGPYLQSLSLTILVNLCSKNIAVINLLFKTVNVKDLVKCLMGLRENEIFSIGVCRLFVALQDIQGSLNANDVHSFITATLKIFIKNLKNGDERALRQCCIFIEDVSNDSRTKSYMLSYDKFDDAIHEILKLSPLIISYTNKNEMEQKINSILKYTLILLLKMLQIELYSMRKFYPLIAEVCIKALDIQDCIQSALELLTTVISIHSDFSYKLYFIFKMFIKDDGVLPQDLWSVINDANTNLLNPFLPNIKGFGNQWFKFILSVAVFAQDFVISGLKVTLFEEVFYDILNNAQTNNTFENTLTQQSILIGCKVCLFLAEINSDWESCLQKILANNLIEKLFNICLSSSESANRKILLEIIKHPLFPNNKMNQIFSSKEQNHICENNLNLNSYNSVTSFAQDHLIDKLTQRLENVLDNNQITDITTMNVIELYRYKNMCMEQRLSAALASAECANKSNAKLSSTLDLLIATNHKQHDLLYKTELERETLQTNVIQLTDQVNDGECALKKFSGKLVAEKMSKEMQIANSQKEFLHKMKEMEEAIENKDNQISSMTLKMQEFQSTNKKLNDKLNEQTTKNNELAAVLMKFEERIKQRDRKLEDATNQTSSMKNDLDQANMTIKTLEKTLLERDKRLTQVTSQLEEMQRVQEMIVTLMGNKTNQNNSNTSS